MKPPLGYRSRRVHGSSVAQRGAHALSVLTIVTSNQAHQDRSENAWLRSSCPALRAASFCAGFRGMLSIAADGGIQFCEAQESWPNHASPAEPGVRAYCL